MARSIFVSFLFFAVLLVGLTSSNAQGVNTSTIVLLNVTGGLVCNLLGNRLPIPVIPTIPNLNAPLVGVNVTLSCDGGQTTVAQAVTNSAGFFQLTLNASNLDLLNITRCRVIIPPPVNASCILLPITGSLQGSITLTSIIQTAVGFVLNFATLPYLLVLS